MKSRSVRFFFAFVAGANLACQTTGERARGSKLSAVSSRQSSSWVGLSGDKVPMRVHLDLGARMQGETSSLRVFVRIARGESASMLYDTLYFSAASFDDGRITARNDSCALAATGLKSGRLKARIECGARVVTASLNPAEQASTAAFGTSSPIGAFSGTCGGARVGALVTSARQGEKTLLGMMMSKDGARHAEMFTSTTDAWNAATVRFQSHTGSTKMTCSLAENSLSCDGCRLTRAPLPPEAEAEEASELPNAAESSSVTRASDGQFYGYLAHEASGRLQLVALNFGGADDGVLAGLDVALMTKSDPVAVSYYGAGDSPDFIAFRLRSAQNGDALVLDGDGDALLLLDRRDDVVITGTWYSKSFGRVGRFALQKDIVPESDDHLNVVPQLSGTYRGQTWTVELSTLAGEHATGLTLPLVGWARENSGTGRRRTISEGHYDPLTGMVSFQLDDGRFVSGSVTEAGLELQWPQWVSLDGFNGSARPIKLVRVDGGTSGSTASLTPQ